jgi:hypothetical protein
VDPTRLIADTVLYEGYILWPYRRSALKNRQRWTFGGVYPRGHSEGRDDDPWTMQTQCLVEGGADARLDARVRFLHVVERQLVGAAGEPVDELELDGERHLSWQEASEREVGAELRLGASGSVAIDVSAGREHEDLGTGAVVRSWEDLRGRVEMTGERLEPGLFRLTVRISNESPWAGGSREEALRRTFCSTHTALRARDAAFVSQTDPPDRLRDAAEACRNEGTWPVLVGEPGERHTVLSSPIILEDYPRIAPESPGDLFDGGEIDGLLTLNILSLTDEEKAEMRASDPRAREILERTEGLSEAELMRLHGAVRDFRAVPR